MVKQIDVKKLAEFVWGKDGIEIYGTGEFIYYRTTYNELYKEWNIKRVPDFPNDLNACYEHLINPREDILRVEFSYRTRYPELEVGCKITMRSWHPDRTKGRVAFDGIAPKGKPATALCKAFEQLCFALESSKS